MPDHDTEECIKNYESREIRELTYGLGKMILSRTGPLGLSDLIINQLKVNVPLLMSIKRKANQ